MWNHSIDKKNIETKFLIDIIFSFFPTGKEKDIIYLTFHPTNKLDMISIYHYYQRARLFLDAKYTLTNKEVI